MIRKFVFGTPVNTDATVLPVPIEESGDIDGIEFSEDSEEFSCTLAEKDVVYGLGEQVRGINKRGWLYESNCSDDPTHTEGKHSLYGAHNFLIIDGERHFGLFIDTPGKICFDIGYTDPEKMQVSIEEPDYILYYIAGDSSAEIAHEFRKLTGRSYIPPKWAFGYGQSRWSYMNENEIRELVAEYRKNSIPIDSVYLDIDYMDHYKDFTIDEAAFPDFPAFVKEMRAEDIHLVPIIDAGVKKEDGYSVYEEGTAGGYFCREKDGSDFVAAVWPGKAMFPDVLNTKAREWFGNLYKGLIDAGIEGFWNDMNEPAIFYSEKRLQKVFDRIEEYKGKNLDIRSFFEFKDLVGTIDNNPEDYASFYHDMDGRKIRHDKVHNLFGFNMTRAAGEAFDRIVPEKRILMFSRSSYIGMHRYGGIWTGDNRAWWSHLELSIKQIPSLNMCGFLFCGSDIGGFGDDTTPDLMMRWLEFGIFTPLMRSHSAQGTRLQELTRFGRMTADYAKIVSVRYMLLPYIYSEYMKAALKDEMYIRPLSFDYPQDERARTVEDQLLVGESIMIAPVYQQNARGRYVYLPENMKLYRFRSECDYDIQILEAGEHYVAAGLNEVLVFVRPGKMVLLSRGACSTNQLDLSRIWIMDYADGGASYEWYDDDGVTKAYDQPENRHIVRIEPNGTVTVSGFGGSIQRI
jgi:alpha-glucosidase